MKNCNFLGDSVTGRSSTTEAALDSLRHLLEGGLGPDVLLLISASEFDKRRSFNKFLLQSAAAEELNKPDITKAGWEGSLMPLINKEAGARGMTSIPPLWSYSFTASANPPARLFPKLKNWTFIWARTGAP